MSLLPIQLQSQVAYTVDAVQESNSAYYFALQGQGGGSTSTLVSPVTVITQPGTGGQNGIIVQSNQFDSNDYGLFVNDVSSGTSLIQLFAQGDVGQLILGDSGGTNNSYFVSGQGGTAIGNQTIGVDTNLILWNPTDPTLALKLRNPTRITGNSGDGIPYDTVYNRVVPYNTLVQGTILKVFNNVLSTTTTNSYTAGPFGQLVNIRILVSIQPTAYNFPAGSILGIGVGFDGVDNNGGWVIPLPTTAPNAQTEGATFQTGGLHFVQPGGLINAFFVGGGASINLGTSLGGNGNITVLLELVGTTLESSV